MSNLFKIRSVSFLLLLIFMSTSSYGQPGSFTNTNQDVFRWDANSDGSGSSFGILSDMSGNSQNSVANNVSENITAAGSKLVYYNQSTQTANGVDAASFISGANFTFEGMFKPLSTLDPVAANYILERISTDPNEGSLVLSVNRGRIKLMYDNGSGPLDFSSACSYDIPLNAVTTDYMHVAFTKSTVSGSTTLQLFYNGTLVATQTTSVTCTFDYDLAESNNATSYVGDVDNIRFWSSVRTADEIKNYSFSEITSGANLLQSFTFNIVNGGPPQLASSVPASPYPVIYSGTNVTTNFDGYRIAGTAPNKYMESESKGQVGFTYLYSGDTPLTPATTYKDRYIYTVIETPADPGNTLMNIPQVLYKEGDDKKGYVLFINNGVLTFAHYASGSGVQYVSNVNGGGYPQALASATRYIIEARVTNNNTSTTKIALFLNGQFIGESIAFNGMLNFTSGSEVGFGGLTKGTTLYDLSGTIPYTENAAPFKGKILEFLVRNSENTSQQTITTNYYSTLYNTPLYVSYNPLDIKDIFDEAGIYKNLPAGLGYQSETDKQLTTTSDLSIKPEEYTFWAHNGGSESLYDIGYNSNTQNAPLNVKLLQREWKVQGVSGSSFFNCIANISVPASKYQSLIPAGQELVAVLDIDRDGNYRTGSYVVVLKLNAAQTAYIADEIPFDNINAPYAKHFHVRFGYLNQYEFTSSHASNLVSIGQTNNYNKPSGTSSFNLLTIDNGSAIGVDDYVLVQDNNAALALTNTLVMTDNAGAASDVKVSSRIWKFNVYGTPGTIDLAFDKSQLPTLPSGTDQYVIVLDQDGVFDAATSKVVVLTDIASYRKAFFQAITDGMYMKLGAVKQNILQSKSNPNEVVLISLVENASLVLNTADQYSFNVAPACLQDMRKSILKVLFNTGDMHTTGDVAFTASTTVTITGYSDFTMTSSLFSYSNVQLNLDESGPEKVWSTDISGYYPNLKKVKVLITGNTPSLQSTIDGNLRLKLSIEEDVRIQIPVASTSVIRDMNVARASIDAASEVIFTWVSDECPTNFYQFQLLRLYNEKDSYAISPGLEYHGDIVETAIGTVIDWSKALTIETDKDNIQLLLTEGTGFYVWRVRAIGNYYTGGVSDSRNWGNWSTDNYPLASPCVLDKTNFNANTSGVLTTSSNTILWYDQFERDKNFIYSRSFTEQGNIHEGMSYATPLLMPKQSIVRLNSNGTKASGTDQELIVSQTMYDYVGRAALSTLPAPVTNDNDISYQEQFLKNSGNLLYTTQDFDSDATYKAPLPITNGDMSTYYSDANPDPSIPSADGYGFTRQLFNNDGTNQVVEMGGVGPVHTIKEDLAVSHTVKITEGGVTEEELISVFGDEAPTDSTVFKTVTTDQNNITSITYTNKEGQVIATCLAKHQSKCVDGPDVNYFTDELGADDPLNIISTNVQVNDNLPFGNNGLQAAKTLVFTEPTDVILVYKITPSLIKDVCGSFCATCGYVLDVKVIDVATGAIVYEKNQVIEMESQTDNSCSAEEIFPIVAHEISLCPGKYTITRQITPNMAEAAKFAADVVKAEDDKIDLITTSFYAAMNAANITYEDAILAYRTLITDAYTDSKFDLALYDSDGILKMTTVGSTSGSYMTGALEDGYYLTLTTTCCSIDIPVRLPTQNPCDKSEIVSGGFVTNLTGSNKLAEAMMDALASQINVATSGSFDYSNFKLIADQSAVLKDSEWNGTDLYAMLNNMTKGVTTSEGTYTMSYDQCKQLWNCWNGAVLTVASSNPLPAGNSQEELQADLDENMPDDGTTVSGIGSTLNMPAPNIVESMLDCYGRNYIGFTSDPTTYRQNAFRVFLRADATLTGNSNQCDRAFCTGQDYAQPLQGSTQQEKYCPNEGSCMVSYPVLVGNIKQLQIINATSTPAVNKIYNDHFNYQMLKGCLAAYASMPTTPAPDFSVAKILADAEINVATMIKQCKEQCNNRDEEFRNATKAFYDPTGTGNYKYYNTGTELQLNGDFSDPNGQGWNYIGESSFADGGLISYMQKYNFIGFRQGYYGVQSAATLEVGKKYIVSVDFSVLKNYDYGISVVTGSTVHFNTTDEGDFTKRIEFIATDTKLIFRYDHQFASPVQILIDNNYTPLGNAAGITNVSIKEILLTNILVDEDVCCMAQSLTDYCKEQCQLDVVTQDCNADNIADKIVSIGTEAQIAKWSAIMYGGFQLAETSTVNGVEDQCGAGWDKVTPDVDLTTPAACLNGVPTKAWDKAYTSGVVTCIQKDDQNNVYVLYDNRVMTKINPITGALIWYQSMYVYGEPAFTKFVCIGNDEFLFTGISSANGGDIVLSRRKYNGTSITDAYVNGFTRNYGGNGEDVLIGIERSGNTFAIGAQSSSIPNTTDQALDPVHGSRKTSPNFGSADYWFFKIDMLGNGIPGTQMSFGGSQFDNLAFFKTDNDGNFYLIGLSLSGIGLPGNKEFDIPTISGRYWVVKIKSNLTSSQFLHNLDNIAQDVVVTTEDTYIYMTKYYMDDYLDAYPDVNLSKYYKNSLLWHKKTLDVNAYLQTSQLFKSSDNGLYVLGIILDYMVSAPTSHDPLFGGSDYFLVKADANGNYMWDRSFGGSLYDDIPLNAGYSNLLEINGGLIFGGQSNSEPNSITGVGNRTAGYIGAELPYGWIVGVGLGSNTACTPKHMCIKWLPLSDPSTTFDVTPDPEPPLPPVSYDPSVPTPSQQVVSDMEIQRAQCGAARYDALVQQYLTACMNGKINDLLEVAYEQSYRHYTLYYYDRAGNLARTVPPQGVDFLTGPSMTRMNHPQHTLVTKYEYNSIGQLVWQHSPDGGITNFIYNSIGQLRFSQNAKQALSNACSYTKYDELGRILEVGECALAATGQTFATITPYADAYGSFTAYGSTSFPTLGKEQQTITVYTNAATQAAYLDQGQTHLRNRVSYIYTYALNGERAVSYFSYDPHGNVTWVMQEIPGQSRNVIGYDYDLISNKVLCAKYNEGQDDAFFHKYTYDADNRVTAVYTSRDRVIWDKDAAYKYYKHGPLKRTELGEDAIQGVDYTFTIQGWLKAVNKPSFAAVTASDDGGTTSAFAADEYGMTLSYYKGDFTRTSSSIYNPQTGIAGVNTFVVDADRQLFNGNISSWVSRVEEEYRDFLARPGNTASIVNSDKFTTANYYTYDDLNRITSSAFSEFSSTGASSANGDKYSRLGAAGKFSTAYSYDGNGNIKTLKRNSVSPTGTAMAMDDLVYTYQGSSAGAGAEGTNNQLMAIQDAVPSGNFDDDIDTYGNPRYTYDAIGNLIQDDVEGIKIEWTVYGKVASVKRIQYNTNDKPEVRYTYNAMGQRIKKEVNMQPYTAAGVPQRLPDQIITTFYVHDASGTTMSIYNRENTAVAGQTGYYNASYDQIEIPIYGSSRVGVYVPDANEKTVALKKFQSSDLDNMLYEPKTASLRTNYDNYWNVATRENKTITNTSAAAVSISTSSLWDLQTTGDATLGSYSIVSNNKATGLTFSGKVGNAIAHGLNANGVVQFKAFTALDYFGTANKLMIVSAVNNVMLKGSEQLSADPNAQIVITPVPGSTSKYYLVTKSNNALTAYVVDMSLAGYGTTNAPQGELLPNPSPVATDNAATGIYGRSFIVRENKVTGTSLLYATRYVAPVLPTDDCGHIELMVYALPSNTDLMTNLLGEVMCRPLGLLSQPSAYTTFTLGEEQGELAFNAKGDELLYYAQKKRTGWFSHQESEVLIYTIGYDGKIAKNAVAAKYTIPVTDASLPGSSAAISADGRFVYYSKDQLYQTNGSAAHIWRYDLRNGSNVEVSGENIAGDVRNLYSGLLVEVADNKSQTGLSLKETDQGITQSSTNNVVFSALTGQIGNWPLQNFRIYAGATGATVSARRINNKRYEISDHLGNVTVVVSDRKKGTVAGSVITTIAKVITYTNYYAFGMAIKQRSGSSEEYRYGYNGKEKSDEIVSGGYDFGARIYDSRIARWFAVDPAARSYPFHSTYIYVGNDPVNFIDGNGRFKIRYRIPFLWGLFKVGKGVHERITGIAYDDSYATTSGRIVSNLKLVIKGVVSVDERSIEREKIKPLSGMDWHFDGLDYEGINEYYSTNVQARINHAKEVIYVNHDQKTGDYLFGQIAHTVQDFYSHSNYVELALPYFPNVSEIPLYEDVMANPDNYPEGFLMALKSSLHTGTYHGHIEEVLNNSKSRGRHLHMNLDEGEDYPTGHKKDLLGEIAEDLAMQATWRLFSGKDITNYTGTYRYRRSKSGRYVDRPLRKTPPPKGGGPRDRQHGY